MPAWFRFGRNRFGNWDWTLGRFASATILEGMPLLTADGQIRLYEVEVIEAAV